MRFLVFYIFIFWGTCHRFDCREDGASLNELHSSLDEGDYQQGPPSPAIWEVSVPYTLASFQQRVGDGLQIEIK